MAESKMADEEDDMINCYVCCQPYELVEEHVPRILPCSHTLCHGCVEKVLHNGSLDCPECREKHTVKEGSSTFPQNKYILRHLHSREKKEKSSELLLDKCRRHGRQANLYCREYECREAICQECLVNNHKFHDIVDVKEERKQKLEALFRIIPQAREHLRSGESNAILTKDEMDTELDSTLSQLQSKHEEIVITINHFFESMKQIVSFKKEFVAHNFSIDVKEIQESLEQLKKIENSTSENDISIENIIEGTEKINKFCEHRLRLRKIDRKVVGYENGKPIMCDAIDRVLRFQFRLAQAGPAKDEVQPPGPTEDPKKPEDTRVNFTCTKGSTFTTQFNTIHGIAYMSTKRLVVAGLQKVWSSAVVYNLIRGTKLSEINLGSAPKGLSVFQTHCTRVAFAASDNFIELHSLEDPTDNASISMAPKNPGAFCITAAHGLFFEDLSTNPRRVIFNVHVTTPNNKAVIHTDQISINDMCYVEFEEKKLLVTTGGTGGIEVYDTDTGKLHWQSKGRLKGMSEEIDAYGAACDERGHLFICDRANSAIQMYELAGGMFMGTILKEGRFGLGQPCWIRGVGPEEFAVAHKTGYFTWKITTLTVQ